MGALDRLKESLFKIRLVPKQGPEDKTTFVKEKQDLPNQIDNAITEGKRVDLSQLLDILTLKGDRNAKYEIFEEMVADGRIGAAVEMYANDTVQYNSEGKIVWVESKDSDVAKYCNALLEDLGIPENIWSWAYCMWLYGDVYLETFFTKSQEARNTLLVEPTKSNANIRTQQHVLGLQIQRYIKKVPNPADIYDLQSYGKTVGFVRNRDDIDNVTKNNTYFYSGVSTDIDVIAPVKYVHICLSPNINRFPAKFNLIQKEQVSNEGEDVDATTDLTFDVKTGQSVLENVYAPYQSLKLKEDSVLLERITKSSIIRVIQVELGDMPESQKRTKLMELKSQIEQQIQMNKETGTIQSRSGAQPTENIIYTTTKNGKGAISTVNIGGDVNIGDLSDLESSENKLYGSLLIPKGLLGADMEGSGLSNGGSLTEMNTTYARRIKRGQVAICAAIKTLINIFALAEKNGDKIVGNFEVKLTPILTVEDTRRDEILQNRVRNVNDLLNMVDGFESIAEETKLNMLIEWLGQYLNQQDIVDILNEAIKKSEKSEEDKIEEKDREDDDTFDFDIGHSEDEFTTSVDRDSVVEPLEDFGDEELGNEGEESFEPELSPSEPLADIEGEDLL